MLSLHWILALTVVFVQCLIAAPINKWSIRHDIERLKKYTCTKKDLIYSFSDLPHKDAMAALDCQIQRLDVICQECFLDQRKSYPICRRTVDDIKRNEQYKLQPTQAANMCETNKTKTFHEFLDDLQILVYKVNSS